ncbi:MAG: guanylate kinase [Patescibacteria group bacterium UBA2163]
MKQRSGKFIMVAGPSGSGKGTLIEYARTVFPHLARPVTSTTRAPRPGEEEGVHRFFLSPEEFQQRIAENFFLEWAEYGGHLYGTSYDSVVPLVQRGEFVLKELEVQGVRQVIATMPAAEVVTIFIDAGSWDSMEARIRARAPISEEELKKRKERYEDEMSFKAHADIIISNKNGELEQAKKDFEDAVRSIIS